MFQKKMAANSDGPHIQLTLVEAIRRHINSALKRSDGKIHGPDDAAELLGINSNTLRNKIDKLNIFALKAIGTLLKGLSVRRGTCILP
jgi:DNA-binding NtrC family response regulator